jgi:hypothetical protein
MPPKFTSVQLATEYVVTTSTTLSIGGQTSAWTFSAAPYGSHEQAELVGGIADTRTTFEGRRWASA